MKIRQSITAAVLALTATLSLTACDPPYPPELIQAMYEEHPVCEEGEIAVSIDKGLESNFASLQETMDAGCPGMSIVGTFKSAPITITSNQEAVSKDGVYAATPWYVDAGVAVVNFADGIPITLTPAILFQILAGEITVWNDPAIAAVNKKIRLPETEISVNPIADENSLVALKNFAEVAGVDTSKELQVTAKPNPEVDLLSTDEGMLTITSLSQATAQGVTPIAMQISTKHIKAVVAPSDTSVFAAASQYRIKVTNGITELTYDEAATPELPKGAEKADLPYPAVFFGWLTLSGSDTTLARSVARFLLRSDEQGTLPGQSLVQLPNKLKQSGTDLVSKGLTLPKLEIKK